MKLLPAFTGQPEPNKIYNTDALTLLGAMPDESIDLHVTSPPYNLRNSLGGFRRGGSDGSTWNNAGFHHDTDSGYSDYNDNMPYPEYVDWQRQILAEMMRTLKPNGAIFYNHKWRCQGGLLQDRSDIVSGFPVRQIIIWDRGGSINFNRRFFLPNYEVIYLICKDDFYLNDGYKMGAVWYVNPENDNKHPAPFPIEIARRCIQSTDAKLICDPFMGSGTTAVAAQGLGRNFIGCDISLNYVEMARRRIAGKPMQAALANQTTIFEALEALR